MATIALIDSGDEADVRRRAASSSSSDGSESGSTTTKKLVSTPETAIASAASATAPIETSDKWNPCFALDAAVPGGIPSLHVTEYSGRFAEAAAATIPPMVRYLARRGSTRATGFVFLHGSVPPANGDGGGLGLAPSAVAGAMADGNDAWIGAVGVGVSPIVPSLVGSPFDRVISTVALDGRVARAEFNGRPDELPSFVASFHAWCLAAGHLPTDPLVQVMEDPPARGDDGEVISLAATFYWRAADEDV